MCRDSLRSNLQKMSKHVTTLEQTSIEDKRRKLEGRLNHFHEKAQEFIGGNAEEHPDILPQFTGWKKGDDADNKNEEALDKEALDEEKFWEEVDDEENSENPETTPIYMPSSLKQEDIQRLQLRTLAAQELELRKGQASDCLQSLRMALGHRAILYRTKVRNAKSTVDKTRAWDNVKAMTVKVSKHARAYRRARKALEHLGADNATLTQYQELQSKHLQVNKDITEENRVGQRSDVLPWFWRLDSHNAEQHDTWTQECKFIFVCECGY